MTTAEREAADARVADAMRVPLDDGVRYDWGNDRMPVPSPPAPMSPTAVDATGKRAGEAPSEGTRPNRRFKNTWRWMTVLGVGGLVIGGAVAVVAARQMGYDWRLSVEIGVLVGVVAGGIGAMLPPLARAIGWTLIAAACAAVAGGAGWLLTRAAPAFIERFVP